MYGENDRLRVLNKEAIKVAIPRQRLPYPKIEKALKKGEGVFLVDLRKQTAHAAAKIISRHLKEKYVAVPAYVGEVGINRKIKGYTFEKESEMGK